MSDTDASGAESFAFASPTLENGFLSVVTINWRPLAWVSFTPMADGTLGVGDAGVEGYAADANGTWLKRGN